MAVGGLVKTPILHIWYGKMNPGITKKMLNMFGVK